VPTQRPTGWGSRTEDNCRSWLTRLPRTCAPLLSCGDSWSCCGAGNCPKGGVRFELVSVLYTHPGDPQPHLVRNSLARRKTEESRVPPQWLTVEASKLAAQRPGFRPEHAIRFSMSAALPQLPDKAGDRGANLQPSVGNRRLAARTRPEVRSRSGSFSGARSRP